MKKAPFHLSLPCTSISKTEDFYVDVIGASLGRHSSRWLDIDLFGNQITFTRAGEFNFTYRSYKFEDSVLPAFHFGIIVDRATWDLLYNKLSASEYEITSEVTFLRDKTGEHISFFIKDPNGHMVEFKCFRDQKEMFGQ
ncbi:MAG: VOC family protein [Flavobacteriaceae bacterium]